MLAADGNEFLIAGDGAPKPVFSIRLDFDDSPQRVELQHSLSGHHRLGLSIVESEKQQNFLAFHRRGPDANQCFHLLEQTTEIFSAKATELIHELSEFAATPVQWQNVLGKLAVQAIPPYLAEALLRTLPLDEIFLLANHLVCYPKDLARLQAAWPSNYWLNKRLPELISWRQRNDRIRSVETISGSRRSQSSWLSKILSYSIGRHNMSRPIIYPAKATNLETMTDLPGNGTVTAHNPDFGLVITTMARRQTSSKFTACILASARNEGPYILDWIAYHRSVGFDHIFLYTNNNTDGSDELLALLAKSGEITWIDNNASADVMPQFRAYAHALTVMPDLLDYRWTLICDLDEYCCFDTEKFSSIKDFIEWQEMRRADAIALPWLIHTAKITDEWRDMPVVRRIPLREVTVNHHVKTLFRTNMMWSSNPHHPDASPGIRMNFLSETGLDHIPLAPHHSPSLSHNPVAKNAWISHFIFRTAPEALLKIYRGRGDAQLGSWDKASRQQMMKTFVRLATICELILDQRVSRCAMNMDKELARIRAIKGVAACTENIKRRFVTEMRAASEKYLAEEADSDEPAECREFRKALSLSKALHVKS